MARLILTFEPHYLAPDGALPEVRVDADTEHETSEGPKLGSDLVVGDLYLHGAQPMKIATITEEA